MMEVEPFEIALLEGILDLDRASAVVFDAGGRVLWRSESAARAATGARRDCHEVCAFRALPAEPCMLDPGDRRSVRSVERPEGTPELFEVAISPFGAHYLEVVREIRDPEELGRLLRSERLSAIGEMTARIVHEIRNPLVAIGGFAWSLLDGVPDSDPRREALVIIVDEVRRLEAIVRDALDYSRPARPRIARCDLARLAHEALELLGFELREAGVDAVVDVEGPSLPAAAGDRDQLFQATVNVMRNAIGAMPKGGTILVHLRGIRGGVEMGIQDTGVGIAPEIRSRIFEPFFTTKSSGSGLGLTIASQILRDHRGELTLESEAGIGTTVCFRIPSIEEAIHVEDPGRRG